MSNGCLFFTTRGQNTEESPCFMVTFLYFNSMHESQRSFKCNFKQKRPQFSTLSINLYKTGSSRKKRQEALISSSKIIRGSYIHIHKEVAVLVHAHTSFTTKDRGVPYIGHGFRCLEHTKSESSSILLKSTSGLGDESINSSLTLNKYWTPTRSASMLCINILPIHIEYCSFSCLSQNRFYPSPVIEYSTPNINDSIHWGILNEAGQITWTLKHSYLTDLKHRKQTGAWMRN